MVGTGRVASSRAIDRATSWYAALHATGFANQPTSTRPGDGLALTDLYVAAAVRCAPPMNRPTNNERDNCAGDVASAWHPFYDRRLRSEHWANAKFQGSAAGPLLLGAHTPFDRIPYFYSDQYDLGMEYTGYA